ncbi:MAG: NTP transferase domain-containing protein [Gemmatimonadota bacterium]|nr:MAG: NTP transferase domain-containing protein [Gemmatimonadota bacterium]
MKAIIPVAGEGTRMRPYTYARPKALLHVAGKPILAHILDKLEEHGIDEVTLIVGHLGDKIEEYVKSCYDFPAHFVEQTERLGIAHALFLAKKFVGAEPLFIVLGDTIFETDLEPVFKGQYTSLGIKEVEDPRRFGIVALEGGFVQRVVEKPEEPETNLALVGMYYIKDPLLLIECIEEMIEQDMKTKGEYQLTDAFEMMIGKGHRITTFGVEHWYDCGKPEALLATNRHLLELRGQDLTLGGSVVQPPVFIEESAVVKSSVIGPHVSVAAGARVQHSILRDSIIGEKAFVSNSMLDKSIVGDNAVIKGSFTRLTIGDMSEVEAL